MAIKDDPRVQALLNKEAAKAEKAQERAAKDQERAVKAATKAAISAARGALDEAIEAAKAEENPVTARALKRCLGETKKAVLAATKGE